MVNATVDERIFKTHYKMYEAKKQVRFKAGGLV
jgi:hypothetical protein